MTFEPSPAHANRARGVIRARFSLAGGRTGAARVFQGGGLRLRLPKVQPGLWPDCEAVLINTAGGMVGGDSADLSFELGPGAGVTITTQSAEKIYRGTGLTTTVATRLTLDPGARGEWLPQETILFDRADFSRRLDVDMAGDASLLLVESLVFGRLAMGETMRAGALRNQWRIRRAGSLVFAEGLALNGAIEALLDRPALGRGARATATLLLIAPDAEARLAETRAALAAMDFPAGASAWNGLLLARLLSPSPEKVRAAIVTLLATLRGRAAPRVWQ